MHVAARSQAAPILVARNPGIVPPWLYAATFAPASTPIPIAPDPDRPVIFGGSPIPIAPDPDTPTIQAAAGLRLLAG